MKMMLRSLFDDDTAKVPFAVIGVLLLLISVIASINLVRMDVNMAKAMSARGEISMHFYTQKQTWRAQ